MTAIMSLDQARRPVDRDELHQLLDMLIDLRERTDPDTCLDPVRIEHPQECSPEGKNRIAERARNLAACLTLAVAGWAINHHLGQAVLGEKAPLDAHDHEIVGQAMSSTSSDGHEVFEQRAGVLEDGDMRRLALAALGALPFTAPVIIWEELETALLALDYGEVRPIVAPAKAVGRGKVWTLLQLRQCAVWYVYFLEKHLGGVGYAEQRVAEAFGITIDGLHKWQSELLPGVIGKEAVEKIKENARAAATFLTTGAKPRPTLDPDLFTACALYSILGLDAVGAAYRRRGR